MSVRQLNQITSKSFSFRDPGENWIGRFSTVSRQGVCKSCKRDLEKLSLSSDQFQLLQQKLLDKSIIGKDVFLKTSPKELSLFQEFMERTGPYDMVLDSLNIGYKMFQRSSNRERAEQVIHQSTESLLGGRGGLI